MSFTERTPTRRRVYYLGKGKELSMGKKFFKLLGVECLYLLAAIVVAALANMIQLIAKEYAGEHSSFIFRGDVYKYNIYAYLGCILVCAEFILLCHTHLVKKFAKNISELHPLLKAVYLLAVLAFGALMCACLLSELFILLETGDPVRSDGLRLAGRNGDLYDNCYCAELEKQKGSGFEIIKPK